MKSIVLVADAFPPLRSSAAVQLYDLSLEFVRQGYQITVVLPDAQALAAWRIEDVEGVRVCRLSSPPTKDIGYIKRTINEFLSPFFMLYHYRRSPLAHEKWDGVIWYSPSIFFGPFIRYLKKQSQCRSYLILRDIFPQWAVDLGLMKKGLPYLFFKWIEGYQYRTANVIGVQSQANFPYFEKMPLSLNRRIEVLQNWLSPSENSGCSIDLASTLLAGRKILVYAGNMGVAQGSSVFLDLAQALGHRQDIGLVLVGRGSDAHALKCEASDRRLSNILFFDEIPSNQISGLYDQCHVGLVVLDSRHQTHNIPGKFLSYMQAGLPVLAKLNLGNDLINLIIDERVGYSTTSDSIDQLRALAEKLLEDLDQEGLVAYRPQCQNLMSRLFSPDRTTRQIVAGLRS